jgi:hypothetical protein
MSYGIDYCSNHPEAKSFYFDAKRKRHLCGECVLAWYDSNTKKVRDETFGRVTYVCPELQLNVGNFESGSDTKGGRIIFNVSDSYSPTANYWFPINEVTAWGYAPFFWFKKLADKHRHEDKLIHCHAGIHRSLMMGYCWGMSLGYSHKQLREMFGAIGITDEYGRDSKNGYIPNDLKAFYQLIEDHPDYSLGGILRELGVPQLLNNTSLRDTTKYQDYLIFKNK